MIIQGFAFWGGVGVTRKLPKAERQRLKEERRQEKLERREGRGELGGSDSGSHHGMHNMHKRDED